MAQPLYVVEYLGAVSIQSGQLYASTNVISTYPTANMMKMKTEDVKVSVNGSDMFPVTFDDESFITSGHTYIFDKNCTIVIGKYVAIT